MESNIKKQTTKNKFILTALLISASVLLIFPSICSSGVKLGINISLYSLIPAILPFMIFSNFVIKSGCQKLIGKLIHPMFHKIFKTSQNGSYAVLLGFLCGYPLGAKITGDLIRNGKISPDEGKHLFKFTNNPSPAFILCYASAISFPDTYSKLKAIALIYIPSIIIGLFSSRSCKKFSSNKKIPVTVSSTEDENVTGSTVPFSKIIDDSIFDALVTISKLTGYIIIFSIISTLIYKIPFMPVHLKTLIPCLLELTSGIYSLSTLNLTFQVRFIATILFSIFGGFCVIFQINSVIRSCGLNIGTYVKYKVISMIICIMIFLALTSIGL